ncbi:hypothetical protein H5410_016299 [Solanum commersonii]|uniref:Uncharacterized protein n=1 Tax=Solanum commersonii TaxID=4109 RepID=A0A9J5ZWM2_SOLCO|nr:hypothetical protein H5410_016299 [Solanum commersonii]
MVLPMDLDPKHFPEPPTALDKIVNQSSFSTVTLSKTWFLVLPLAACVPIDDTSAAYLSNAMATKLITGES